MLLQFALPPAQRRFGNATFLGECYQTLKVKCWTKEDITASQKWWTRYWGDFAQRFNFVGAVSK